MWYAISLLIGIAFLAFSGYLFYNTFHLVNSGQRTIATVTEVIKNEHKSAYKPRFAFETVNGEKVIHDYHIATTPSNWKVGDEVVAFYDTNEPTNVIVLTFGDAFGTAIAMLLFGLLFTVIGGGYFLSTLYFKSIIG
jgi:hypothetical protein